jgi:hypothetical protein
VAWPTRANVSWQSAASFKRQRDTFDPPQINNPIILLAMGEATCPQLDGRSGIANKAISRAKQGVGSDRVDGGQRKPMIILRF